MLQQAGEKTLLDALARVFADVSPPREMRERARTADPFIRRKFRSTTKQFGRERVGAAAVFIVLPPVHHCVLRNDPMTVLDPSCDHAGASRSALRAGTNATATIDSAMPAIT
ncbi:hypothetical protein [Burkholderia seminalis]|uniref:hypothetical protein n=1 Tax=Burkholderia seminalis TaxID=488731 RepID=UPI001583591F|nr:hypothetical protein [Burkholderia seminalis]MCA8433184.1 hypothetical protein [Burkholderia seminalis]